MVDLIASAYIAGKDNAYNDKDGYHADGGAETSSSVPISAHQYTFASKDNLPLGTVVRVTNNGVTLADGSHPSIVNVKTDRAGRHKIDLVAGVATKALGISATISGSSVSSVQNIGDRNGDDPLVNVEVIGKIDLTNAEELSKFQDLSHQINTGQQPVSALEQIKTFNDSPKSDDYAKIKDSKLASLADPKQIAVHTDPKNKPKCRDPRSVTPAEREDEEKRYANSLFDLVKSGEMNEMEAMMIIFAMMIVGALTGKSMDEVFSYGSQATGKSFGNLVADGISGGGGTGFGAVQFHHAPDSAPEEWKDAWNAGYKKADMKALLAKVPDALAKVMADETGKTVAYQELAGNDNHTYGVMVFKSKSGEVMAVPSGGGGMAKGDLPGASTGTCEIDPRYPNAGKIPDYKMTHFHWRTAEENARANCGPFSFDLQSNGQDSVAGTGRGALRVHIGGALSLGCQHVSSKDAELVVRELADRANSGGGLTYKILPSQDQNNVLVQEAAKYKSREEAKNKTPEESKAKAASADTADKSAAASMALEEHRKRLQEITPSVGGGVNPPQVALARNTAPAKTPAVQLQDGEINPSVALKPVGKAPVAHLS